MKPKIHNSFGDFGLFKAPGCNAVRELVSDTRDHLNVMKFVMGYEGQSPSDVRPGNDATQNAITIEELQTELVV
jgi:hypothetical protein